MKIYRTSAGPVRERPYYKSEEIENICTDELRKVDLYPETPEPIRIERFIEKRFGVRPEYAELSDGVLGYTRFGPQGVEEVVVSRTLSEKATKVADRQLNSTLAHEAGHGLLHAYLFVLEREQLSSLFGADLGPSLPKILCRGSVQFTQGRGYDGRWWEFQANRAIGALLLPRPLVLDALTNLVTPLGTFGLTRLEPPKRPEATRKISETFEVNPMAARIRLTELFPESQDGQLAL